MTRGAGVMLAAIVLSMAAFGYASHQAEQTRQAGIERSLLRLSALAAERARPGVPAAGISTFRPEVMPVRRSVRRAFAGDPDFHAFHHRCTSCHMAPDPSMHQETEWPAVVSRMTGYMMQAGLLPIEPTEHAAVNRFLARAAPAGATSHSERAVSR